MTRTEIAQTKSSLYYVLYETAVEMADNASGDQERRIILAEAEKLLGIYHKNEQVA